MTRLARFFQILGLLAIMGLAGGAIYLYERWYAAPVVRWREGKDELSFELDLARFTGDQAEATERAAWIVQRRLDPKDKYDLQVRVSSAGRVRVVGDSGLLSHPDEVMGILGERGILEFRIAPRYSDAGEVNAIREALAQFRAVGPENTRVPNLAWFEIDSKNAPDLAEQGDLVTATGGNNKPYILLYTDRDRALTHGKDRQSWSLTDASMGISSNAGQWEVQFSFDATGAGYLAELTSAYVKHPMAILLDDKAITAPNIQMAITGGSGVITMGSGRSGVAVRKEVERIVVLLRSEPLPASVRAESVAVRHLPATREEVNAVSGYERWWGYVLIVGPALALVLAVFLLPILLARRKSASPEPGPGAVL